MLGGERFRIYPCRGEYAELVPAKRRMVNALVYPLPHTHGLGVHLSKTIHGNVTLGPTVCFLEAQGRLRREPDPARGFPRAGALVLPELTLADLRLGGSGIRPKLHPPDESFADFLIARDAPSPRVQAAGIESPGLTSCLSIGEHVADLVGRDPLTYALLASFHRQRTASKHARARSAFGLSAPGRRASSNRGRRCRGRRERTGRARCGSTGRHGARRGGRHETDRVAMRAKAPAQIRVLPVQEVALVEAAEHVEGVRDGRACSAPETQSTVVDARPPCRQSHCGVRRPADGSVRSQRTRPSEQTGQHVGIAAGVPLRRSVGVEDERRDNRAPRVGIQRRHERRQRARHQLAVRVHDQDASRSTLTNRLIHAAAEADVLGVAHSRTAGQTPSPRPRCRRSIRCRPTTASHEPPAIPGQSTRARGAAPDRRCS